MTGTTASISAPSHGSHSLRSSVDAVMSTYVGSHDTERLVSAVVPGLKTILMTDVGGGASTVQLVFSDHSVPVALGPLTGELIDLTQALP